MEIRIRNGCEYRDGETPMIPCGCPLFVADKEGVDCVEACMGISIGDIDKDEFDVLCNLVIASEKHLTSLTMARMVAVFKNAYAEFNRFQKINKKKA